MPASYRTRGGPSPYNDPDYRAAKRWLKANPRICWHPGCEAQADTLDHVPALMDHTHVRGARCCEYRPACRAHNCGDGAAKGNRARVEPTTPW